jgi:hypothetical protein
MQLICPFGSTENFTMHRDLCMLAVTNALNTYAQLFFFDPQFATDSRHRQNPTLKTLAFCASWTISFERTIASRSTVFISLQRRGWRLLQGKRTRGLFLVRNYASLWRREPTGAEKIFLPLGNELALLIPGEEDKPCGRDLLGQRDILKKPPHYNVFISHTQLICLFTTCFFSLMEIVGDISVYGSKRLPTLRGNGSKCPRRCTYYRYLLHQRPTDQ